MSQPNPTTRLSIMLAGMSERERRLVALLVVALAVFVIGGAGYWGSSALSARERRVRDMRESLSQIRSLEAQYKAKEQDERQAQLRLKSNNASLFSLLQQAAGELGLTLNDLNERRTPVGGQSEITEVSVEVNLKEVSIDKLNTFLQRIEGQGSTGLVKIMKLKVKTRYDNAELLDVNMSVSTWQAS